MGRRRAEMALRSPQSIEINGGSVESLLAEHADWLSANGRAAASISPVSLARADLRDADLRGRDLRRCDLAGADLRGADLSGSDFRDAIVTGANFQKSEASATNLAGARFGGADLTIANLPRGALRDIEIAARSAATRFQISAAITALVALGMTAAVLVTRDWALFKRFHLYSWPGLVDVLPIGALRVGSGAGAVPEVRRSALCSGRTRTARIV